MVILEAKEIEKSLWNEPAPDLAPAQAALNAMAPSPLQRAEAAAFNVATRYGEVQGQHGVGQQQLASRGAPAPTSSSTKVLRELEGDAAPTEQGIRVLLISSPLKAHDLLQNLCLSIAGPFSATLKSASSSYVAQLTEAEFCRAWSLSIRGSISSSSSSPTPTSLST